MSWSKLCSFGWILKFQVTYWRSYMTHLLTGEHKLLVCVFKFLKEKYSWHLQTFHKSLDWWGFLGFGGNDFYPAAHRLLLCSFALYPVWILLNQSHVDFFTLFVCAVCFIFFLAATSTDDMNHILEVDGFSELVSIGGILEEDKSFIM